MDDINRIEKMEPPEEVDISIEEQVRNQKKYEKDVDKFCEEAENLIDKQKIDKIDEALSIYIKILRLIYANPWGIKAFQVFELYQNALNIKNGLIKKNIQIEELKKTEELRKEEEDALIHRKNEEKKKKEEERNKKIQNKAIHKQEEEKISTKAFSLLEQGSKFAEKNEYDSAIESYEKANELFLSINWPINKVKESIDDLKERRTIYNAKKANYMAKEKQEKYERAYNLLGEGSKEKDLKHYQEAIEFYEEAFSIFKEIGTKTEIDRVNESLIDIKELSKKEQKRIEKLERQKLKLEERESIKEQDLRRRIEEETDKKIKESKKSIVNKQKSQEKEKKTKVADEFLEAGSKSHKMKNYTKAIEYYKKAEVIFEEINAKAELSGIREAIVNIQQEERNFLLREERKKNLLKNEEDIIIKKETTLKSKEEHKKKDRISEEIRIKQEQQKKTDEAYNLLEKGSRHLKMKNFKESIEFYQKAKGILKSINAKVEISRVEEAISNIYNEEKKYQQRLEREKQLREKKESFLIDNEEILKSVEIQKKKKDLLKKKRLEEEQERQKTGEIGYNLLEKGTISAKEHQFDDAIRFYEEALNIFTKIGARIEVLKIQDSLLNIKSDKRTFENKEERIKRKKEKRKVQQIKEQELLEKIREEENRQKKAEQEKFQLELKAAKSKEDKIKAAYSFLEQGSRLIENKDYDNAINYYEDASRIFAEMGLIIEKTKVDDSLSNIEVEKQEYLIKVEKIRKEEKKQEELRQKQKDLLNKAAAEEKLRKLKEQERLEKIALKAKTEKEKTKAAYNYIEKGSELVKQNDYDSAINYYVKSLEIFKELKSAVEIARISESLNNLRRQKQEYEIRLKRERIHKEHLQAANEKEKELLRKINEEEERRKKLETIKLRKELETVQSIEEKSNKAYSLLEEGSIFIKNKEFDNALELYEKAEIIFKEINSISELQKVRDSISNVIIEKQKHLAKLKVEKIKLEKKEQEKKKEINLLNKIKEEEDRRKSAEAKKLQIAFESAKNAEEKNKAAYNYLEMGSELIKQNDYPGAVDYYEKALLIFKEINSPSETARTNESLMHLRKQHLKYIARLEQEKIEKERMEEARNKEKELIEKLKAQERKRKEAEAKKLKSEEQAAKTIEEKRTAAFNYIEKASILLKQNDFDSAIGFYEKARTIMNEIGSRSESFRISESLNNIKLDRKNYHTKLEREKLEEKKIKEAKQKEADLLNKIKIAAEKRKKAEEERLQIELNAAKSKEEKTETAYSFLELGSTQINQSDYTSAIEYYERALLIFEAIDSKTEISRTKESILNLRREHSAYLAKLELERQEKVKIEIEKKKEEELLQRLKEQEEMRKSAEVEKLKREIEAAKSIEDKVDIALDLLERGSILVNSKEFDESISLYEKARDIFEKIGSKLEADKVHESIRNIKSERERYILRKEREEAEKIKSHKMQKQEEKLVKELKEEENRRKLAEMERLKKESELAKTRDEKFGAAYRYLDQSSKLATQNDYDTSIDYNEKALAIFEELKSISEISRVRENIIHLHTRKKTYLLKIERERIEHEQLEEAQNKERELLHKLENEEKKRKEAEKEKLQFEMETAKTREEKIKVAYNFIETGSELIKRFDFDSGIEYYEKAQEVFEELNSITELNSIKESLSNLQTAKLQYISKLERERIEKERAEEDRRKENELILRLKNEEEKRKIAESERLQIELKAAKTKEEKTAAAYNYIEQGTQIVQQHNDYETAIEYYEKSLSIFEEINSPIEFNKIRESLKILKSEQSAYLLKLEKERKERLKLDKAKIKEKELLNRLKQEEEKRREAEAQKLRLELESAKTREQKSIAAYNFIEQGSDLIKNHDYDGALSYYEKARSIFQEISSKSELTQLEEGIVSLKIEKESYLQNIEKERKLKERLAKEKFEEEELIRKEKERIEEEKRKETLRVQQEIETAKSNEEKASLAYSLLSRGSDYISEKNYDTALNAYERAKNLFINIKSEAEALKVQDSINSLRLEKEKYEIKQEKERIEKQRFNDMKLKEEELIRNKLEEEKRRKAAEEKKLQKEIEEAKSRKEKSNLAYILIEKGTQSINNDDYEKSLDLYNQALSLFIEIESKTESERVRDSIAEIQIKKNKFIKNQLKKLREEEELAKIKKQTEELISKKIAEEENRRKIQNQKLIEDIRKLKNKEEKSNLAYKLLEQGSDFVIKNEFNEGIKLYQNALSIFIEIDSETDIKKIKESLNQIENQKRIYIEKLEKEKIEKIKLESMKSEQEELIQRIAEEEEKKSQDSVERLRKELESVKNREDLSKIAFDYIENSNELIGNKKFEDGVEDLKKAMEIFNSIGWNSEAEKIGIEIDSIKEKWEKHLEKLEREKQIEQRNRLEQEELERLIRKEKRQMMIQRQKELERERKDEEIKIEIAKLQDEGANLLNQGSKLSKSSNFEAAKQKINQAVEIFKRIKWEIGIKMANEALLITNREQEKFEIKKHQKIKTLEEAQKEKAKLEIQIKNAKDEQERKLIENQKSALEKRMEQEKRNKIEEEIVEILSEGSELILNNKFEEGLSLYEQILPKFDEISWDQKREQIIDMINTAKKEQVTYLKKLKVAINSEKRKKLEEEEFQQRVKNFEEEQRIRQIQENEKQMETLNKENRIQELREKAINEIDRANASIDRNKFQKALKSLEIALENFNELGWKEEISKVEEKINYVNVLIRDAYSPTKVKEDDEKVISEKAFKLMDNADKNFRLKKFDEALPDLKEAKNLFNQIKWTKAAVRVEEKIDQIEILAQEKEESITLIKNRQRQKLSEEAFDLLDQIDMDKNSRKFKSALKKSEKAQKIFREIEWEKEADDMEKMIQNLRIELEKQTKGQATADQQRIEKIEEEEKEEEKLRRIIEERKRNRREARRKL